VGARGVRAPYLMRGSRITENATGGESVKRSAVGKVNGDGLVVSGAVGVCVVHKTIIGRVRVRDNRTNVQSVVCVGMRERDPLLRESRCFPLYPFLLLHFDCAV
jgi:hypothetical protein